jgi:hypothetical protein
MNPRTAVGLPARGVGPLDLAYEPRVFDSALTRIPAAPGIITARAYPLELAHRPHREEFLVRFDKGKDVAFLAEVNSMAFFKMSCSSFRRS